MPIIKSAKKKLRKDINKTKRNNTYKEAYKKSIHKAKKEKDKKLLQEVFSRIDKAAKKGVIHKNKANRLKSRISAFLEKK